MFPPFIVAVVVSSFTPSFHAASVLIFSIATVLILLSLSIDTAPNFSSWHGYMLP